MKHNQEIQTLPTPIVITVNMADERIINEPSKFFSFHIHTL
jgi:hypothetical protein